MKARRIVPFRSLSLLLTKVLEGARLVVSRVGPGIPPGAGPGDDVTDAAKGWSQATLSGLVKRGYVTVVPLPGSDPPKPQLVPPAPVSDRLAHLRGLAATVSKGALRAALEGAGVSVPTEASREDMFKLRQRSLERPSAPPPVIVDDTAIDIGDLPEAHEKDQLP